MQTDEGKKTPENKDFEEILDKYINNNCQTQPF